MSHRLYPQLTSADERLQAVARFYSDDIFPLRSVLLRDPDAHVRAEAATRLSRLGRGASWLREGADDRFPLVRQACYGALAALNDTQALPLLQNAVRTDPVWWSRRAAVAALATIGGDSADSIDGLLSVLTDPFWRVRKTAIFALLALGEQKPSIQERILNSPSSGGVAHAAAMTYLQRHWSGHHDELLAPNLPSQSIDPDLDDDDPAVITMRLEQMERPVSLQTRVQLLANPHEPLRQLAIERLLKENDTQGFQGALIWLEHPLVPYAMEAAKTVLAKGGDRVYPLVKRLLESTDAHPSHVCFALSFAHHSHAVEWVPSIKSRLADPDSKVRISAVTALMHIDHHLTSQQAVLALLDDDDIDVRAAAVHALWPKLDAALSTHFFDRLARHPASIHAHRDGARLAHRMGDATQLQAYRTHTDPAVRATALFGLNAIGMLSKTDRDAARQHLDPWIRMAVIDEQNALQMLETDSSLEVKRAALAALLGHRQRLCDGDRRRILTVVFDADDPYMLVASTRLLSSSPADLPDLLRLSSSDHEPVRNAVRELLIDVDAVDLGEIAAHSTDPQLQNAALRWSAIHPGMHALIQDGQGLIQHDQRSQTPPLKKSGGISSTTEQSGCYKIPLTPFAKGGTGNCTQQRVAVRPVLKNLAPLIVSGAHPLLPMHYREAFEQGATSFFWEPGYTPLTQFLRAKPSRRKQLQIIAGSYDCGARGVKESLDTALRRLRTDYIDVFLLFWARSATRINADAYEVMQRLQESGKVRAVGFSTHHRDLACQAIMSRPWDVVMTRHSAAHIGAERNLFQTAKSQQVGVLTFSALCYGRMLNGKDAPSAPDCYRYNLSRPGVTGVISAPRSHQELLENLSVLRQRNLTCQEIESIRTFGAQVYAESRDFAALVRRNPNELPNTNATLHRLLNESIEPCYEEISASRTREASRMP